MNSIRSLSLNFHQFIGKYWLPLYCFSLLGFLWSFISNIIHQQSSWSDYHLEIFLVSFFYFIYLFIWKKPKPLYFILIFLFVRLFALEDVIELTSQWFFFNSPFSFLFDSLASKDSNVFFILCFIVLTLICFVKLAIDKIKKKKWELSLIFTTLTLFSFLIITLLFHYVLIEKYFKQSNSNELEHIEQVFHIENLHDFQQTCLSLRYICSFNGGIEDIQRQINDDNFINTMKPYVAKEPIIIKGNFSTNIDKNIIYLVYSHDQKWVINPYTSGRDFQFSENWLMFCLTVAHSFWLFFYLWLLLYHYRRTFK